jgi:hypothetical protein
VPFQNHGWKRKQRVETSQLKPELILAEFTYGLKPVPFKLTRYRSRRMVEIPAKARMMRMQTNLSAQLP